MLAAAISAVICGCGWRGELCFTLREKWVRECPECKAKLTRGQGHSSPKFYGNRRFAGSESNSITKGFHPKEVGFVKSKMPKSQHCIDSRTGDVSFSDRSEERTFNREFQAMADSLGGLPGPNDQGGVIEL